MNTNILQQVVTAYNESTRILHFRASEAVPVDEAVKIMALALDCKPHEGGYNDFKPNCLKKLPKHSQVTLAREGSVCVYVTTSTENINEEQLRVKLGADECDILNGFTIRVWWD